MSLFENENYRWRETFFVLFKEEHRPTADLMCEALKKSGTRYDLSETRETEEGFVESLTLVSPYDFAAMDISYVSGEDVASHIEEIMEEMEQTALTDEESEKLARIPDFDARFDIFHFEQLVDGGSEDEEDFMDPGTLLIVLQKLADLCHGVGIDPQAGSVM